jgi:hypothetical protein
MLKHTISRLFALCVLFATPLITQAFPDGAGSCDVGGIVGGHGKALTSGVGGYAINVQPKDVSKGQFSISLTGGQFKGLLMYAVDGSNKPVGSFTPPQGLKQCDGSQNAITHSSNALKDPSKITMQWNSGGATQGNLTFLAVVVTNPRTNYYNLKQSFNLASNQPTAGPAAGPAGGDTPAKGKGGNFISDFFSNYTLFAVIIGIATFLYVFGAAMEALLRRQQQKAKQYAKDITNGFAQ